jgi:hypothetical protein
VVEGSTQTAGVPGTAATWVAPTGRGAVRVLGGGGCRSHQQLWVCGRRVCAEPARGEPRFFGGRAVLLGR